MYRRRTYRRRARRTARVSAGMAGAVVLRRITDPSTITLTAGAAGFTVANTLSSIVSSDLIGTFEKYKIISITAYFTKQIDPGNSGIINNTCPSICVANDVTGNTANPANLNDPGAFFNHKSGTLVAGRTFKYTYYPRVVDSVNNNGTATAAGTYNSNPWLLLSAAGAGIPHQRLRGYIKSTNASDTSVIDVYYEIRFMVAGLQ